MKHEPIRPDMAQLEERDPPRLPSGWWIAPALLVEAAIALWLLF